MRSPCLCSCFALQVSFPADERDLFTVASSQGSTKPGVHSSPGHFEERRAAKQRRQQRALLGDALSDDDGDDDDDDETVDPEAVPFGIASPSALRRSKGRSGGGGSGNDLPVWARGPVAAAFFSSGGFDCAGSGSPGSGAGVGNNGNNDDSGGGGGGGGDAFDFGAKAAEEGAAVAYWSARTPCTADPHHVHRRGAPAPPPQGAGNDGGSGGAGGGGASLSAAEASALGLADVGKFGDTFARLRGSALTASVAPKAQAGGGGKNGASLAGAHIPRALRQGGAREHDAVTDAAPLSYQRARVRCAYLCHAGAQRLH